MLRVTDGSIRANTLYSLQQSNSRLADLQEQLSTGRQITRPSDDPSGTIRALQLRGAVTRNTQYAASAADALGWMSTSDSTYTQLVSLAQKAQTLVVQGLNQGASTGESNSAIAAQIDKLREQMINLANTTYNGRPVFGGTTSGKDAYDVTGNFIGDTNAVKRQVGDSTTVQVNQSGPDVFEFIDSTGPTNLFALLSRISTNLRSAGPTSDDLDDIGLGVRTISAAQAVEGATYNQVTAAQAAQSTTNLALKSELSDIQDIDLAAQAVAVSAANATYNAALQTTANIRQISLLDFLS